MQQRDYESEFKIWLLSKEQDEIVGKANSVVSCPLARWLRESGGGIWTVGFSGKAVRQEFAEIPRLPTAGEALGLGEVLVRFVANIDRDGYRSVSAQEALEALDQARQELAEEKATYWEDQ